jgi:hypothetical protein
VDRWRDELDYHLRGSRITVSKEMVADPLRRVGRLVVEVRMPA